MQPAGNCVGIRYIQTQNEGGENLYIFGKTDIGKMRSSNQDVYYFYQLNEQAAFGLVCDGMGGENGGHIASAIASNVIYHSIIEHYQDDMSDDEYKSLLISSVSSGNIAVYDKSLENQHYMGMGTTVDLLLLVKDKAYIAHVGDSRVYMLRDKELYQVTKDHSMVQTLLEQGKITQDQAQHHPQKNMITRAVGVSCFVDIDYIEISNVLDTTFLLCSDGLTNTCTDEKIQDILNQTSPEKVCDTLVTMANDAGGMDNITVVYMTNS